MKKRLIILGVALLLAVGALIGSLLIIRSIKIKQAANKPNEEFVRNYETLHSTSSSNISHIEIQGAEGTYYVTYEDGEYVLDETVGTGTNQARAMSLFSAFSEFLSYNQVGELTDPELDLQTYGLDNPTGKAVIHLYDGTTYTYTIGSMTPTNVYCYLISDQDNRVHVCPKTYYSYITYNRAHYYGVPVIDIQSNGIRRMRLENEDGVVFDMYKTAVENTISLTGWHISEPVSVDADGTLDDTLKDGFAAFQLEGIEPQGKISDPKYGFEKPNYHCVVEYLYVAEDGKTTEHIFEMTVGKIDREAERAYVMIPGDDAVYYCKPTKVAFLNVTTYDMAFKYFCMMYINRVTQVSIKGPEDALVLDIDQVVQLDEAGNPKKNNNGDISYKQDFYVKGEQQDSEQSRYMYQHVLYLHANGQIIDPDYTVENQKPVYEITFVRNTAPEKIEYKFYEYDLDFYAVTIDGVQYFVIRKTQLSDLMTAVEQYRNGNVDRPVTNPTLGEQG